MTRGRHRLSSPGGGGLCTWHSPDISSPGASSTQMAKHQMGKHHNQPSRVFNEAKGKPCAASCPDRKSSMSLSVHVQCHGHPSKERLVLDGLSRAEAALLSKNSAWKELDVNIRRKENADKNMVETGWALEGGAPEPGPSQEGPGRGSASEAFLSPAFYLAMSPMCMWAHRSHTWAPKDNQITSLQPNDLTRHGLGTPC